ncbi:hypothetical protein M2138_001597 [Dysgonomonadaceae bacterium PH5-43]|nr:hypothetical protein [Dysgonomonadaceae bacterium PH5-43]
MNKIKYTLIALVIVFSNITSYAQDERILSFTIDPIHTIQNLSDIKVKVKSATASEFEDGENIDKALDGDMNTMYHSSYDNTVFPVTLQFNFEDNTILDNFIYYPRIKGSNGCFEEIEVLYKLKDEKETSIGKFNFQGSYSPSKVTFPNTLENVEYVKILVNSGLGFLDFKFASCAEIEFYRANSNVNLSDYFIDDVYSGIKEGVTKEDIMATDMPLFFKILAAEFIEGTYSKARIRDYEAYRPVTALKAELKTNNNYNQYENPTGIYIEANKQIAIFVGETHGESLSFNVRNWNTGEERIYILSKGINFITSAVEGNSYIDYYTNNFKTAKPIRIHIYGGKDNGVFYGNGISTNDDWKALLANASSDYLDIVGKYVNLTYYVSALKTHCPSTGVELINIYDEIIEHQFELMGLFKYERVPKNHMFGRNTLTGFMSAGAIGANFQYGTLSDIGNFEKIVQGGNSWGIAHEFGHINQISPDLRWVGTAECTNNVYSSYTQYVLQKKYSKLDLRLEHETCKDVLDSEGGVSVIGGRFNAYLHYGVLKGENWIFQWGPDAGQDRTSSDHFVKLVPLWQLNLYFKIVEGAEWSQPHWYADICELVRLDTKSYSHGQRQINFIKRACEVTKTDLTEFFEKAGMLKPISKTLDDYGYGTLTITEAMCKEVKDYVAANPSWKKPDGMINYISGNTVDIYENKENVVGTLNAGVKGEGVSRTISHSVWKNAVAYETYKENELVRITMAGTGTKDNSSTRVPYPAGSTKIVAVSWNGVRTTVYQPN